MTGRELGDQPADMGTYWDRCPSTGITVAREHHWGMTIRQRMAMHIAAGIPSTSIELSILEKVQKVMGEEITPAQLAAKLAVEQTDALLDELAKERVKP